MTTSCGDAQQQPKQRQMSQSNKSRNASPTHKPPVANGRFEAKSDFVHQWLEQTQRRAEVSLPDDLSVFKEPPWRPHNMDVSINCGEDAFNGRARHGPLANSDVDIMMPEANNTDNKSNNKSDKNGPNRRRKRTRDDWNTMNPDVTEETGTRNCHTYEKRSRRQTRPDRYDARRRRRQKDEDVSPGSHQPAKPEKPEPNTREEKNNWSLGKLSLENCRSNYVIGSRITVSMHKILSTGQGLTRR